MVAARWARRRPFRCHLALHRPPLGGTLQKTRAERAAPWGEVFVPASNASALRGARGLLAPFLARPPEGGLQCPPHFRSHLPLHVRCALFSAENPHEADAWRLATKAAI